MKYFKKLKIRHKVTALGIAAVLALGIAAAATISVSSVQAQDVALDKTYGIDGVHTQAHLMDLLRVANDLEKKAKAGDAASQYKLGLYYYKGMIVGKDIGRAIKWLDLAHKQGYLKASYTLGELHDRYSNDQQGRITAFRYFKVAADGGLVDGQVDLGVMYYLGRGTDRDYNEALAMFIKASKQRSHRAEYYIGIIYELGRGVEQNYMKALRWYEISAISGNKLAAYNAGLSHYQGRGTSVSMTEALKYYKISAELGYRDAQFRLGNMYYLGEGTDRKLEDAFVWLMVAQLNGHKVARLAFRLVMKKMTVDQVQAAGARVDRIMQAKYTRVWF